MRDLKFDYMSDAQGLRYHEGGSKSLVRWFDNYKKEHKKEPSRSVFFTKLRDLKIPHVNGGKIYTGHIKNPNNTSSTTKSMGQYGSISITSFSKVADDYFKNTSVKQFKKDREFGKGSSQAGNNFYQIIRKHAMDNKMPEASSLPALVSNIPYKPIWQNSGGSSQGYKDFYRSTHRFFVNGYFGGTGKSKYGMAGKGWTDSSTINIAHDKMGGFGGRIFNYTSGSRDYTKNTFRGSAETGTFNNNSDLIGYLRHDLAILDNKWYDEWTEYAQEQVEEQAKDDISTGLEGYSGDKDTIDTSAQSDADVLDFSGYKSDDAPGSQTSYSGESPIDPNTQRYDGEKNTDYVKNRGKRTAGIREVLGEEIFSLGLKGEDGNLLTPEQLSQFATYTTEDGIEQPILDYERSLEQKMEQGDKDVGVDARSLLATRARQGVMGAASAGGKSVQQNIQDASLDKMSNRQQASSAMEARISSVQDKHDARAHLTKLKTELLSHDIKRKQDLYKTKAKTAIGMAGIEETAAEYAKDLIKINSTK